MTDLSTIKIRRQFNSRKKRKYSFDFNTSKKLIKLFKNDQQKFGFEKQESEKRD